MWSVAVVAKTKVSWPNLFATPDQMSMTWLYRAFVIHLFWMSCFADDALDPSTATLPAFYSNHVALCISILGVFCQAVNVSQLALRYWFRRRDDRRAHVRS